MGRRQLSGTVPEDIDGHEGEGGKAGQSQVEQPVQVRTVPLGQLGHGQGGEVVAQELPGAVLGQDQGRGRVEQLVGEGDLGQGREASVRARTTGEARSRCGQDQERPIEQRR